MRSVATGETYDITVTYDENIGLQEGAAPEGEEIAAVSDFYVK